MNAHFATEISISAASALTAGRLLFLRLAKRFPALAAWLMFFSAISFAVAVLSPKTPLYFRVYLVAIPLYCIFGIMAVRELFAVIFDHYPGIRTVGRWAMYGAIVLALIISSMATSLFWSRTAGSRLSRVLPGVYYLQLGHRSVTFGLAIVIISLLFSISRYPLHLSRNALVSCGFFGAVFLSDAAQSLADSLAPRLHNDYFDWGANFFVAAGLLAWAGWLQPETAPATVPLSYSTPAEDHLLQELASLNQLLSRAARR
jgi:hypothetical protein